MDDAFIPLIIGVVGAVVFVVMGWMGSRETLPRNAFFGIRVSSTTSSDEAWCAAHKVAAPYSYAAAAVILTAGIASAALGTTEDQQGFILAGGLVVMLVVWIFGIRKAIAAAKAV